MQPQVGLQKADKALKKRPKKENTKPLECDMNCKQDVAARAAEIWIQRLLKSGYCESVATQAVSPRQLPI